MTPRVRSRTSGQDEPSRLKDPGAERSSRRDSGPLAKSPTGIRGLDELTGGGLPAGRPTLVCGGPGCGKTLLAMEFIVRGATAYKESGVVLSFEESEGELTRNVASLGFNLRRLVEERKLVLDHVRLVRSEIEETGGYDLEGLFVRLGHAIDSVGAKRVVLDTIEALFASLNNEAVVRSELQRLFRWLKQKKVTAIITAERGDGMLTRHGLEEYVSDCVILLDHRVTEQLTTRRLRVVKYRGSAHGTNEYPFLIDENGISVWPITSLRLAHRVTTGRITTGVPRLDTMLGGGGFYRGSSVLVSGTAGTGKTSVAATFARSVCARGGRCLFLAHEESPDQIVRNMRSIGVDLRAALAAGHLRFHAIRPTNFGLEMHLAQTIKAVTEFSPDAVVVDPISSYGVTDSTPERRNALVRLIDFLKTRGVTTLMTDLARGKGFAEQSGAEVSSIVDTWIVLRDIEMAGERNRGLHILKSRGMAHSNQVREFHLTSHGIELIDVYIGPGGVLAGSARLQQEASDAAERAGRAEKLRLQQRTFTQKRKAIEGQIAALEMELAGEETELQRAITVAAERERHAQIDRAALLRSRHADAAQNPATKGRTGGNR